MTTLEKIIEMKHKYNLLDVTPLMIRYLEIYDIIKNSKKFGSLGDEYHKEISYKLLERQIRSKKK